MSGKAIAKLRTVITILLYLLRPGINPQLFSVPCDGTELGLKIQFLTLDATTVG